MSDPEERSGRRTSDAVIVVAAAALCLPILAIGLFAALARTDDIDAFLYAYYAKRMLAGQRLYADLWDNKPPGVFWADALGLLLSGGRFWGVVLVCSLAAAGSCVMLFLTARRLYGVRAAAVTVVMASLFLFLHDYHVGANRPSTFYVLFELCVMACYVHATGRARGVGRYLFPAGMFAVAAVMCRQTAFSAAGAVALHQMYLTITRRQGVGRLMGNALWFGAGCALGVGAVVAGLWGTSDLAHAWHGIVTSNLGYFARPGRSELLPELFRWEDHLKVLGLPLILAAGAVIHAVGRRLGSGDFEAGGAEEKESNQPPGAFALVVTWFPIALYLALVGPSKRMMYFGVALAPLVMLAGYGVWLLMRERGERGGPRFSVIVAVLWFGFMMVPGVRHQWDAAQVAYVRRFDERSTPRHHYTVECIRAQTGPDDPVFMWGYLPAVYWYADRPLGQRYLVTTLIDQWQGDAQPYVDGVISELRNDPPKAIVMDLGELADIEDPPETHAIRYGDFGSWLRGRYFVPDDCKGGNVWIRRD